MTIRVRGVLVLLLLGVVGRAAHSADGYADGWTKETLAEAIGACSDELNERTWKNTLRDQGIDPATAMPPEIRRALEPQIAARRGLCECTVKETAKKYGRAAYRKDAEAVGRYAEDLVKRGVCKRPN
jgi:hypothetical protein